MRNKRIKTLENELKNMLSETVPGPRPVNPRPTNTGNLGPVNPYRIRIRRDQVNPYFIRGTGVEPTEAQKVAARIREIMSELSSFKGTPLEGGDRAKMLKKELNQLSGTGLWAKKNFFVALIHMFVLLLVLVLDF